MKVRKLVILDKILGIGGESQKINGIRFYNERS